MTLLSTGGVERNAIIGEDSEKRQKEIPIIMLNPGGVLNYAYDGEIALRESGLPYAIVRSTGNCCLNPISESKLSVKPVLRSIIFK